MSAEENAIRDKIAFKRNSWAKRIKLRIEAFCQRLIYICSHFKITTSVPRSLSMSSSTSLYTFDGPCVALVASSRLMKEASSADRKGFKVTGCGVYNLGTMYAQNHRIAQNSDDYIPHV